MADAQDPIPNEERLYHFFYNPDDYAPDPTLPMGYRVRSNKFNTRKHTLSFNRDSIWSLETHKKLAAPNGYGICSLTAGELRGAASPDKSPLLDIIPEPINPPDVDPLLKIPNPAHASVNRRLTGSEVGKVAVLASANIHICPKTAT